MVNLKNMSGYTKSGILLALLGFLTLAIEDFIWDENIKAILYLIPVGCFISSFIGFSIAAKDTANK
jgi:hypothetical protein